MKIFKDKEIISLKSIYIYVLKKPDEKLFIEGMDCEAIYFEDGYHYPCTIEKILPN